MRISLAYPTLDSEEVLLSPKGITPPCPRLSQPAQHDNAQLGYAAASRTSGPTLYLPLLSFAGAFPTTLLYGLVPPIALLVMRMRAAKTEKATQGKRSARTLLPGGEALLGLLGLLAVGMLGTNFFLALQSILGEG
eukprot:2823468-Pleurochrysis_carterae.AAC.1